MKRYCLFEKENNNLFNTWVGPEFDIRWEPLKIDACGFDDDTKGSPPNDMVGLDNTELEFDTSGAAIDKLNPPRSDVWTDEGTELGGRVDVRLVDTDCTGACGTVDVEGLIPRTELRTGDGCGKGLGCEGGVAVDIVGGEVMDRDAMDDTKSEMLDAMLSVSARYKVNWHQCVKREHLSS